MSDLDTDSYPEHGLTLAGEQLLPQLVAHLRAMLERRRRWR